MEALIWNDTKHRALLADFPTWLVWCGDWTYEL